MRNWSVDTSKFDKNSPEYEKWQLEQLINYGLNEGEKLSRAKLKKYWDELEIDPAKRRFLKLALDSNA